MLILFLLQKHGQESFLISDKMQCSLCDYSVLLHFPQSLSTSILSINCTDPFGHTPLHKACLVGEREMVELFIRHGALLDSRTKDNDQTPLHLACQYNQKDVSVCVCVCVGGGGGSGR